MPKYYLLYNRLSFQICPDFAPEYVEGDSAKAALTNAFHYSFRRVYGEALKSPDIVVHDGRQRMGFIAVNKKASHINQNLINEQKANGKRRVWDAQRKRWLFSCKRLHY